MATSLKLFEKALSEEELRGRVTHRYENSDFSFTKLMSDNFSTPFEKLSGEDGSFFKSILGVVEKKPQDEEDER